MLFLLTLARMGGLASEVAMQSERKRAMQTVLRATDQERVRLAADLEQGLEVALHNQVRAFEATSGVACAISTGLQSRLDPDLETVLYRSPRRR